VVNKSGRIGREGEHKTIAYLAMAGFTDLIREGKRAKQLDIISDPDVVPVEGRIKTPIESRRRKRIDLQAWVRDLDTHWGDRWALFLHPRDARAKDHMPAVVVFPAAFAAKLLYVFEEVERKAQT
jgi:hypothetical protein